jgi:hypothetical protein
MKILLSWETLILGYLVLICFLLLAGCSTHHMIRVGDTTYSAGISLNKEVREYE